MVSSTMLPYLWDGKKFHKIHYYGCREYCCAWVRVSRFKKVEKYGMDSHVVDHLVKTMMKDYGWSMVKAVRK